MNDNNDESNNNAASLLTLKYQTLDDYMNNSPLSNIDESLSFTMEDAELDFNKPLFDMAFIITHKSLIPNIGEFQSHFHSKFAFTTHCIFLPDANKLRLCIRDLKLHQINYAIVLDQDSLIKDSMDLYILYPIIEVQKKMCISEVSNLVDDDFKNLTDVITHLRQKKRKPHPLKQNGNELFNMNDDLRYHMCLLADHRMLDLYELKHLQNYLEQRKLQLEKAMGYNSNLLEDRPLEACRQERLKYYIYEPISNDSAVKPSSSTVVTESQRNLIKFSLSASTSATPALSHPSIQYPAVGGHRSYETPIIQRAKTIHNDFSVNLKILKGTPLSQGIVRPLSYEILQGKVVNNQVTKKNDSECVEYSVSDYCINNILFPENQDVISLSSGSCTPPMEYDLIAVTPPSCHSSPSKVELGKRKSASDIQVSNEVMPKFYKIDLRKPDTELTSCSLKNTPDILINLFRFILNVIPHDLPHNNVLLTMLIADCNAVQNGIMEPTLKNVKIDYFSCKTNGAVEIIQSINSIYGVGDKNIEDLSDLQYVWKKYFPDHVSNLSLLIVFYKFIKLLIIFGLFNSQSDRLKLVLDAVEKINYIVNFTFEIPILSENEHLNFTSDLFMKNYNNHDKLHTQYFDLPHMSNIQLSKKNLDSIIKKKKIEFVLGPLLTYFVNSINSIHQQMQLQQIKMVYNALRTLRYCLREIYPINSPTTVFNSPKTFSSAHNDGFKDIADEAKWLLDELKYYQCILFTEKHYEFINSLLDFCLKIEEALQNNSESMLSQSTNSLIILDPIQFIDSFSSFEGMNLQYHPETEISYWKEFLKGSWIKILQKAFKENSSKNEERSIIKEINNLLPSLWNLRTFDEAVTEAAKLNYTEWARNAQINPSTWYESFQKVKLSGISWLNNNQLSCNKAVEEFRKYEILLENEFRCQ